jgi:nucleoside-diphosphate-sugar epimerase
MNKVLISFGHGYTAGVLARILVPLGWRVVGTTRSQQRAEAMRRDGVEPILWPRDIDDLPWEAATHVLSSAGPDAAGDPILAYVRDQLQAHSDRLEWVGYLSTTAVYGDHAGAWVDETTPLTPSSTRGEYRVRAEAEWSDILGLPLHIFRLAGIYGPGRGPFSKVRSGKARRIVKPGQVFSRIHVDDIAQIIETSMKTPRRGAIYNLCDDEAAPPQDVIAYAAKLLKVELPPEVDFDKADMTPMARSFYGENKRVRNDLVKRDLGITLKYPNYRMGLDALREATAQTRT